MSGAVQQKRFNLLSAVVIFNFMKMDMATKTVEAAETAMRCVSLRAARCGEARGGGGAAAAFRIVFPRRAHLTPPSPPPNQPTCSNCMDETEVATSIREAMNRDYADCTWQVFVGRNFGSQVTYEETRYIYFYIGQVGFVVFSSN